MPGYRHLDRPVIPSLLCRVWRTCNMHNDDNPSLYEWQSHHKQGKDNNGMLSTDALPAAPHVPITMHDFEMRLQFPHMKPAEASRGGLLYTGGTRDITRDMQIEWKAHAPEKRLKGHCTSAALCISSSLLSSMSGRTCAQHEGSCTRTKPRTRQLIGT